MSSFDVIVVGGRCAGASTAMLLAQAGARVLVVERGTFGSDTLSTHALMRGAVFQLQRWGLLPAIVAAHTPPVRTTTFRYTQQEVTIDIEPRFGVTTLFAPRRALLDRLLVDAAVASGAIFEFGVQVSDVTRDASGRVNGIVVGSRGGHRHAISAGLVVGADGLYSTIASRVAASTRRQGRHATAILYAYWQGLQGEGYQWGFRQGLSVGAIPTNDATCVFLALPAAQFPLEAKGDATSAYHRLLAQAAPELYDRLRSAHVIEHVRGFGGQRGTIRQSQGPGWALVGDAGYFKDPLTAHGITDALRDAELLARAVLEDSDAALARYESTRDALSHELFDITDRIASFAWDDESLPALHRSLSREMTRETRALAELESVPWGSRLVSAPHAV